MSKQIEIVVCQRCGRGFVLTATYRDFLARGGRKVVVPLLCPTCFRKAGALPKQSGKVKWFNPRKHYGFIVTAEGEDVFFHQEQILGNVAEEGPQKGQATCFHFHYSTKGPEALNVEVVEG